MKKKLSVSAEVFGKRYRNEPFDTDGPGPDADLLVNDWLNLLTVAVGAPDPATVLVVYLEVEDDEEVVASE